VTVHEDLFLPEFQEEPYETYAFLREEAPVYREPRYGNWVLTRFDDVLEALRDWQTFSSDGGPAPFGVSPQNRALVATDPPYHDQLRALVSRAFTPRRVAESEPRIRRLVADQLDAFPSEDVDLVPNFSVPIPVVVIAEMLGVAPELQSDFRRWSDALVGLLENPPTEKLMAAALELSGFLNETIEYRRKSPGDDLISGLVHAEIEGRKLELDELNSFCLLLLVAGNETTTNLISNQMRVLSERPDLWKALRANPERISAALEETVRWDAPVQNLARKVTRRVTLHGVDIPEGDRVLLSYAGGNRDSREFPDAEEWQLERDARRHLGFGHGVHFCLGAGLARLEARLALEALLERYETVEPGAASPQRLHSSVIRGFESLPLRLG
jgi:hypothetical protein